MIFNFFLCNDDSQFLKHIFGNKSNIQILDPKLLKQDMYKFKSIKLQA